MEYEAVRKQRRRVTLKKIASPKSQARSEAVCNAAQTFWNVLKAIKVNHLPVPSLINSTCFLLMSARYE